jgi:hypothetical protein
LDVYIGDMGNIMAASQSLGGISPPASMPPPPPPTVGFPSFVKSEGSGARTPADSPSSDQQHSQKNELENPGSMEDLNKKCKGKQSLFQSVHM